MKNLGPVFSSFASMLDARIVGACVLLCVCILLGIVLVANGADRIDVHVDDATAVQSEFWVAHIERHGPRAAYADFANWVASSSAPEQHSLAHVMGGALFAAAGLDGLQACTSDYSYGCYHEFLGQAIHARGLPIIETLSEICTEALKSQSLGCQHGIGHGLTGYLGYDLAALTEALGICEQLGTGDIVTGCGGGVFMEYNLQSLLADDGSVRPYEEALGWMYPCEDLPDQWRAPCYFWQTQWWQQSSERAEYDSYEEHAQVMGGRCREITNEQSMQECFRGIGYNAPGELAYELDPVVRICDLLPTETAVVECRAGAAGTMLANPSSKSIGYTVCDGLKETDHEYCMRTATDPH